MHTPYRCFRISEFIYTNYRPFRIIDQYEVWISNDLAKTSKAYLFSEPRSESFLLGHLAYQWGSLDEGHASIQSPELATFILKGTNVDETEQVFALSNPIDKSSGNYIHLRIEAKNPTTAYLGYGDSIGPNFTFRVRPSSQALDYIIRVSTQWGWVSAPVKQIWLSADLPIRVEKGVVRKGD